MQNSEYTKSHEIVYFKWVDCMIKDLYLSKAIIKKTQLMFQKKILKILADHTLIIIMLS